MSLHGVVEKWMDYKGYGFIKGDDGLQYFVYNGMLVDGLKLVVGERVSFDVGDAARRRRRKKAKGEEGALPAVNVQGPAVQRNKQGELQGTVKEWNAPKSYGFIHSAGRDFYVHHSAFEGAKLDVGAAVFFDELPHREHRSGRGVAVNVTGPAVRARGQRQGTVRRWEADGRCGYVEDNETGRELVVDAAEVGGLVLAAGKDVFFDLDNEGGEERAVNVSGPAVVDVKTFQALQAAGDRKAGSVKGGRSEEGDDKPRSCGRSDSDKLSDSLGKDSASSPAKRRRRKAKRSPGDAPACITPVAQQVGSELPPAELPGLEAAKRPSLLGQQPSPPSPPPQQLEMELPLPPLQPHIATPSHVMPAAPLQPSPPAPMQPSPEVRYEYSPPQLQPYAHSQVQYQHPHHYHQHQPQSNMGSAPNKFQNEPHGLNGQPNPYHCSMQPLTHSPQPHYTAHCPYPEPVFSNDDQCIFQAHAPVAVEPPPPASAPLRFQPYDDAPWVPRSASAPTALQHDLQEAALP